MHTETTEAYEPPTVTDVSEDGPSTVCAMVQATQIN
jgi:hypothetical protein